MEVAGTWVRLRGEVNEANLRCVHRGVAPAPMIGTRLGARVRAVAGVADMHCSTLWDTYFVYRSI